MLATRDGSMAASSSEVDRRRCECLRLGLPRANDEDPTVRDRLDQPYDGAADLVWSEQGKPPGTNVVGDERRIDAPPANRREGDPPRGERRSRASHPADDR